MAGVLDMFDPEVINAMQGFGPSDADRQRAMNMGLLSAGLGILGSNRGFGRGQALSNAIGQGGMMGLGTYQQQLNDAERDQMRQFQTAQMAQGMVNQQKQAQKMAQFRAGLSPEQQQAFDVAPQKVVENLPMFQKQQLVEVADPNEPLRTQKIWMRPGETQGTVAGVGAMPDLLDPRIQNARRSIAAAGRAQTNVFNTTKDDFKNERDLRNDFAGLPTTKAFNEVQTAYDQIGVALKKQSPAGDLAAATKIMKILDPGSVVRESELGMAMAATGALDRVQNYADMLIKGTKLNAKQRQDFGDLSRQLYEVAAERYDQTAREYQGVAKDYNLNPERVAKPSNVQSMKPKANASSIRAEADAIIKGVR